MRRRTFLLTGLGALAGACVSAPAATTPTPPAILLFPESVVGATLEPRRWILREPPLRVDIAATFQGDAAPTAPKAWLYGTVADFERRGDRWVATLDTSKVLPGTWTLEVRERLRSGEAVVAKADVTVTAPVYVAWTLDHEGYDEPDDLTANVAAVADAAGMPITILFHPRTLIPGVLPDARRLAIAKWALGRAAKGDEIGMHVHAQFDFVRDAGVAPRTSPRWGIGVGGDGYDVPLTAYEEDEQRRLVERGLQLFAAAGLPRPTSFRAGGQFADARTLRVVAASGFTVDTTAHDAGVIGALKMPWTLPLNARPYRPSATDANAADPNGLALLEVPVTAGNTYSDGIAELRRRQGVLWGGGAVTRPVVLDYVSHPSTFVAAERTKVESAFAPLLAARADRDAGPVRFVRLRELPDLAG